MLLVLGHSIKWKSLGGNMVDDTEVWGLLGGLAGLLIASFMTLAMVARAAVI